MSHSVHRRRRNALSSFFSGASVRRLEPILKENLEKLLSRLEQPGRSDEVVQMHYVFKAYTSHVINQYAFRSSFRFLDAHDYGRPYFEAVDLFFSLTHVFGHFPLYARMVQSAPSWLVRRVSPALKELVDKQMVSERA